MMAAAMIDSGMTEGALDLSAKAPESKATSPVPSVTSDTESHHGERSSSVSDDGHDSDGSTCTAVKPILFPTSVSSGHVLPHSTTDTSDTKPMYSPGAGGGDPHHHLLHQGSAPSPAGGNRPFKMYPFEPMQSSMQSAMYSQLAAAAAASSAAAAGLYQYPGTPSMPGMGLLDSSLTMSSPISQYLQQRKRRMEARTSSSSSSSSQPHQQQSPVAPAPVSPSSSTASASPAAMPHLSIEPPRMDLSHHTSPQPSAKKAKLEEDDFPVLPGEDRKDASYWERRRKNNEAAKRSRDARRAKEEEIALRAAFLEQENLKLRAQVAILKNETAKLHYMLYNRM